MIFKDHGDLKALSIKLHCTIDRIDPKATFENFLLPYREKYMSIEKALLKFDHKMGSIYSAKGDEMQKLMKSIDAYVDVFKLAIEDVTSDFKAVRGVYIEEKAKGQDMKQIFKSVAAKIFERAKKIAGQVTYILAPILKFFAEKVYLRSTKATIQETNNVVLHLYLDSGMPIILNMIFIGFLLIVISALITICFDKKLEEFFSCTGEKMDKSKTE